jgi:hypothetical protein
MDQHASLRLPCCDGHYQRRNCWFCARMRIQRRADNLAAEGVRNHGW